MSTPLRRYELLLPRRFNDGQPVPDSLIADTLELEQRFGAVSSEAQVIKGQWTHCFPISHFRHYGQEDRSLPAFRHRKGHRASFMLPDVCDAP
jgi:hypothetical protein